MPGISALVLAERARDPVLAGPGKALGILVPTPS